MTAQLLFDSHAHYDDPRFDSDRESFLSAPEQHGVLGFVNVGTDLLSSKLGVAYSQRHKNIYCSVGVHPSCVPGLPADYLVLLEDLSRAPKAIAIGEIGLDYHLDVDAKSRKDQCKFFEEQLALAQQLELPVIIHSRDAKEDTMAVLGNMKPKSFVLHCFSYDLATMERVCDLGGFLSFTGVVTFKNAVDSRAVLAAVPADRLLLETDSPYMAPEPYRGQRCDSSFLRYIAACFAGTRNVSFTEMVATLNGNAERLFGITLDCQ
ncbi:MAG: TatD family hydrolase [Oscillospiraceae bacterium]|jgi:TatD DNase family protein|nr:TatD family hydrolase [Oscillospiraceae bacterium]